MKALISCALWSIATLGFTAPAGTEFTYQGLLSFQGTPAEGAFDFRFSLFDAESGGAMVGSDLVVDDHPVSGGVFTASLDFGADAFMGEARWLEVEVREGASNGVYTTLTPRKPVTASPFALDTLFILPNSVGTAALQDDAVTQSKLADNSVGTSQIQNNSVSSSDIRDGAVSTVDIAPGIYRSRSDLYEVTEGPVSIGLLPQTQSVSCLDANDLPLFARCGSASNNAFLATYVKPTNWSDTGAPAESTCSAINVHPSNPSSNPVMVSVSIVCVSVP